MPPSPTEPVDLLDLKLLPAWVKEPTETKNYAHYEGEEIDRPPRERGRGREPHRGKARRDRSERRGPQAKDGQGPGRPSHRRTSRDGERPTRDGHDRRERGPGSQQSEDERQKAFAAVAAQIT